MLDLGKIECRTALEVKLLAELLFERRLRTRLAKPPVRPPEPAPRRRLTFLAPPPEDLVETVDCDVPAGRASIRQIQAAVAQRFRTSVENILSLQRKQPNTLKARHAGMLLCHLLTARSYSEIARMFERDQSTVRYVAHKNGLLAEALCASLKREAPLTAWVDEIFHRMAQGPLPPVT